MILVDDDLFIYCFHNISYMIYTIKGECLTNVMSDQCIAMCKQLNMTTVYES
jgi:hypothetical protein